MINYRDLGNNLITIANTNLDDLDIDIIDGESGAYINFNNQDWCVTLALHITKRVAPFNPIDRPSYFSNATFGFKGNSIDQSQILAKPTEPMEKIKEKPISKDLEELTLLEKGLPQN
jgi:hypothetical protein